MNYWGFAYDLNTSLCLHQPGFRHWVLIKFGLEPLRTEPGRYCPNLLTGQMRKNAIVIGMPRSGTSLSASIFAAKGYFTAEPDAGELRQGDEYNPMGYFEAQTLIDRNARIFARVGFKPDNTWLYEPIPQHCSQSIKNLEILEEDSELVARYQQQTPWLWKDPRLCYTIAYWHKLIDWQSSCILLLKRKPSDIHMSFLRLGWRKPGRESKRDVLRRVKDHIGFAEAVIEEHQLPHVCIDYDDYSSKPEEIRNRLSAAFGLELTRKDLGYSPAYDHSGLKGRITTIVKVVTDNLPLPMVRLAKSMIPKRILSWLFPEKKP